MIYTLCNKCLPEKMSELNYIGDKPYIPSGITIHNNDITKDDLIYKHKCEAGHIVYLADISPIMPIKNKEQRAAILKDLLNKITHSDCMDIMKDIPDKAIDLAIVDPPYGINAGERRGDTGRNKHIKQKNYKYSDWDNKKPTKKYFTELFRISKNQIVWGGNYFIEHLKNSPCIIIWDKKNGTNLYADCEIAWCSFESTIRKYEFKWHGYLQENMKNKEIRIHPTQKPIALYKWILKNYAKENDLIIDTHSGSGSCAIACHLEGFNFIAIEKDIDYYNDSVKRLEQVKKQGLLFA